MAFGTGNIGIPLEELYKKTTEMEILDFYFGIRSIPCVIASPLRKDNNPSFGIYTKDKIKIKWKDFSTKSSGGLFDLLMQYWNCSFQKAVDKVWQDLNLNNKHSITIEKPKRNYNISTSRLVDLQVSVRQWQSYDLEYWKSYGITLEMLKYADVYPVKQKFLTYNNEGKFETRCYPTDKYAYAYVERKEGTVTIKLYQPFNQYGYKWLNKHNASVISLWTKMPEKGKCICICSSVKDALCLWNNTGIPSIALQGEGYSISETAIAQLKARFSKIFICFDNDNAGLQDGVKLSKETGFINLVLPPFENGKDISDLRKLKGKKKFNSIMMQLFKKHM